MLPFLLLATALSVGQAEDVEAYRVGPYDILQIIVPDEPADYPIVGSKALTVGPDGLIAVTYIGDVLAEGKTTAEIAQEIGQGLIDAGQFVDPQILVRVISYGAERISVLGAVHNAGYFPFREELTIRDAIAMAGGANHVIASSSLVRLVHSGGTTESYALSAVLANEDEATGVTLSPGDAVVVQESAPISVLGYVRVPGDVRARAGARLSEAIALAGGVRQIGDQSPTSGRTAGDASKIVINRADGTTEIVALVTDPDGTPDGDPSVHPGDVIYVPASRNEVTVLGLVVRSGVQSFQPGETVSDAIAKAGGPVRSTGASTNVLLVGDLSNVTVHHGDGTVDSVNLDQALEAGDRTADPELRPGDTIIIERRELEYYVLGKVSRQGRYALPPGARVLDLYAIAGGSPLPDRLPMTVTDADLANCILSRADGTQLMVDLPQVARNPASELNVELSPGDSLWVPEADRRVIVAGYVERPSYFQFRPGDTVRDAIALAGGVIISPTGTYMSDGDPHNVLVIHEDGTQQTLDTTVEDAPLSPGDEIRVPYARKRVTVLGYVASPGFVIWHEGDTVLDVIASAGGADKEDGDRFSAVLVRRTEAEPEFIRVDLSGAHDMDDAAFNVEVLPDDIVLVPKSDHTDYGGWLANIRNALSITGLLGSLF